jgi:hypothetical protein
MRIIQQMVDQEVQCRLSSLVSTLAQGYGGAIKPHAMGELELKELCEQAAELAAPVPDYEEAAIQAGWEHVPGQPSWWYDANKFTTSSAAYSAGAIYNDPQAACEANGLDPIDREVVGHWAVSQWLAEKLIEQGEKVDTDFAGLCVWARTTTGQQISADRVIERIYADMVGA